MVADRAELGGCHRITAGEQGHVVPLTHQLLRQVGDDAFRAAIQFGGDALIERGHLRDSHLSHSFPRHFLHEMSLANSSEVRRKASFLLRRCVSGGKGYPNRGGVGER